MRGKMKQKVDQKKGKKYELLKQQNYFLYEIHNPAIAKKNLKNISRFFIILEVCNRCDTCVAMVATLFFSIDVLKFKNLNRLFVHFKSPKRALCSFNPVKNSCLHFSVWKQLNHVKPGLKKRLFTLFVNPCVTNCSLSQ